MVKEKICSVEGCSEPAVRSFSRTKVTEVLQGASLTLKSSRARRAHLCTEHYKIYKKQTREEKRINKWRYGA
ncbi:MAG: hypothetical protein ACFFCO_02155 [Promethearchaeota archaeon]